jgi:hypothetical protein
MAYGTVNADVIQSSVSGVSLGAGNASAFKNRIINGNFLINQRNGTNAVTTSSLQTAIYFSDRWYYYVDQTSKLSFTQTTTAPAGFNSSVLVTVLATDAVGPEQLMRQAIEGYNVADLGWGTANAKPAVLSFWVKSSITGTFGGSLQSVNTDYCYPYLYTINSANTWEQKTVTITPPTTGTFGTTTGIGVTVGFEFGLGYLKTTANAWTASNTTTATGAANFCSNLGATMNITGVQLEVGSFATGFDYRSIGTELALCQRYCYAYSNTGLSDQSYAFSPYSPASYTSLPNSSASYPIYFPVTMRTAATISNLSGGSASSVNRSTASIYQAVLQWASTSSGSAYYVSSFIASAEL